VVLMHAKRERAFFSALIAPAVVVVMILTVYPVVTVATNSLFDFDYIAGTRELVGFDNYRSILSDRQFLTSIGNTVTFVALAVILETGIGFGMALLLYKPFRGDRVVSLTAMAPMMLSTMVVSATWRTMFHFDIGILNSLLEGVGFSPVRWLIDPDIALFSIVLVDVWQWTPFAFIILSAAPQDAAAGVPRGGADRRERYGGASAAHHRSPHGVTPSDGGDAPDDRYLSALLQGIRPDRGRPGETPRRRSRTSSTVRRSATSISAGRGRRRLSHSC
jgi:hypothetical protein